MDVGSSSTGAALNAAPQTVTKLVGPPYRKRAKNAVLNDPTLEQVMGSKEKALDTEEFPVGSPVGLDDDDKAHWTRLRNALFDQKKVDNAAAKHTNTRSFGSELAHSRQTLRMLQDVSAGTRAKFKIQGSQPKRAPRGKNAKTTTPKTNGIAKAKRTKSKNARESLPSQPEEDTAVASSSAAAQEDDDKNAMDYMPSETVSTKAVSSSAVDVVFETPEERTENDEALRKMAAEIREEHPALRAISPDTMKRISHLVDLGLW